MDARCTPAIERHLSDEAADLDVDTRPSRTALLLGDPRPVAAKSVSVPLRYGAACTMTKWLAPLGQAVRSATQKAQSASSGAGLGRSFLSAAIYCRSAKFSMTRLSCERHMALMARIPSEMRNMSRRTMAVKGAVPTQ